MERPAAGELKFFEREKPKESLSHKFVDPALFVDFSHFPIEFHNYEQAIQVYN